MLDILPPLNLAQPTGIQALTQHVQFCFTHRPLQAEKQPVIVRPRIIDPFDISDQRAHEGRQVQ
jgi:hypothetical protein